jgi:hypothetical protein
MKKIIIPILIYFLYAGNTTLSDGDFYEYHEYEKKAASYVYNLNYIWMTDKIKKRYLTVIYDVANKYDLNPYYLVRQINTESHFRWWGDSGVACGPMGVNPTYWSHLLYREKELQHITTNEHKKYLKRIGYNIKIGGQILRHYFNKNKGDIKLGYVEYWAGRNSKEYRLAKRNKHYKWTNKYVASILTNI